MTRQTINPFFWLNSTVISHVIFLFELPYGKSFFLETSSFAIRILLAPEQDYFNEKRLIPSSSNLRWKWFADPTEEDERFYPTPNYNSAILFDCHIRTTSEYLQEVFRSSTELINALKLFKIWLEQRQLSDVSEANRLKMTMRMTSLGFGIVRWGNAGIFHCLFVVYQENQ